MWFTGGVLRRRATALPVLIALASVVVAHVPSAASATDQHHRVRVSFVLRPKWLPIGYSVSGGGSVSPPGGLRVYPNTGVSASLIIEGSNKHPIVPILFTLDYYGYHDPESKNIMVTASPTESAGVLPGPPNTTLHHRRVSVSSYTQGVFHNLNVDISWREGGDVVDVTTQGLAIGQAERFVEGLAKGAPPRHSEPIPAATTTLPTTAPG